MRVKWNRNLDVPVQQRGQASTRDSTKDDKRKGFLHIFKFRDRKNEDERKKGDEIQPQPPKENSDGKIRKTVTFADQQTPGSSVVCNRKGRRVSTDAVDMTVFKVSKNESTSKSQEPRVVIEHSPLFKRIENDGASGTDIKYLNADGNQKENKSLKSSKSTGKSSSTHSVSDKIYKSDGPGSRNDETEVHSLSDGQTAPDPNLPRTSGKIGKSNSEEYTHASKIPVPTAKETFFIAKDVFKSDFWTGNVDTTAKTKIPLRLGLENEYTRYDRNNVVRKDSVQSSGNKEEKMGNFDEMLRSKIPVSEKIACKDTKIKVDRNVNEKSQHQICLDEVDIPHNLYVENNKHALIKTPVCSPVGYCGSKLVLPKVEVGLNDNAVVSRGCRFQEDSCVKNIGLKRFESNEYSCQSNIFQKKHFITTNEGIFKPEETVLSHETKFEDKSGRPEKNRISYKDIITASDSVRTPVKTEYPKVISLLKVPISRPCNTPTVSNEESVCLEKPSLKREIYKDEEAPTSSGDELITRDIKTEVKCNDIPLGVTGITVCSGETVDTSEIEKKEEIISTTLNNVEIESTKRHEKIPIEGGSFSTVCMKRNNEQSINSLHCPSGIFLMNEVKDRIFLASNAPIPINSGIENMRNLLDTSVIIVNHRELSSRPWICNIFTKREGKQPCIKKKLVYNKDIYSSHTAENTCTKPSKSDETSCSDKLNIREIVFIPTNILAECRSPTGSSLEMITYNCDQNIEDTLAKPIIENQVIVEKDTKQSGTLNRTVKHEEVSLKTENNLDLSKAIEQDAICKLIEDDNVAFIDEQIDMPEETTIDHEKEVKIDLIKDEFSIKTALITTVTSGDNGGLKAMPSQVILETDFGYKSGTSEDNSCCQDGTPSSLLVEHLSESKEIVKPIEVSMNCQIVSATTKVSLKDADISLDHSTLNSVSIEKSRDNCGAANDNSLDKKNEPFKQKEVLISNFPSVENNKEPFTSNDPCKYSGDVLSKASELVLENTQNEENRQHEDETDIFSAKPLLQAENTTMDSVPQINDAVELEDQECQYTPTISEVNCGIVSLKKYDSLEFIDDYTDEETNNEITSTDECKLLTDISHSIDGQTDTVNQKKDLQEHISQDGNVFKTEPKTSQPPSHGKYGGHTQTPAPPVWSTRVELAQEIQRLGTLCEARTKELNHMKMNFRHASLGFDAFVVLFQYLTDELDAFSQPRIVLELEKTHAALEEAEAHLHQYQREFEEIKAKHSQELCKLEKELNQSHQETIENLNLDHTAEVEELIHSHEKQLAELTESHIKQCQEMEETHSVALLELKNEHCQQIEELKIFHADQLEAIENSHHETRMELNSQLKELEQQCKDLKHQAKLVEEALQRDTDTKIQWISAKKADLEKEVDSLKTVLDMRRSEIHSLRKENLEMKKELEKLPVAKEKIKMLEAKAEDLQALVNQKIQLERQLSSDHQNLKENYEKESKVNTRLSMENEELMWKLKQNAEANLFLSSFSGASEGVEKSLSPIKSPSKQSVSLPMFFHSIENNVADNEKMSLPVSSNTVTPCKKLPPLSRKCSSPIRTPSFVGASPPGPCSRKCKLDLKAAVSPRKQRHKSHSSDKKLPSKEVSSISNQNPADTSLKVNAESLQNSRFSSEESCTCIKNSLSSSLNGVSGIEPQPDCLAEMDHNAVLFNMLDGSNGSSNEDICSGEVDDSDMPLNFEHYNMLITNQMLSRKYKELTHLEKERECMHEFEGLSHSNLVFTSSNDNLENTVNTTEADVSSNGIPSKDFMFDEQHFAENQPQECPSFPHQLDHSFHKKDNSWTISSLCSNGRESVVNTLPHTSCDSFSQPHQQPESSPISDEDHPQTIQPSNGENCSHPLQPTFFQERNRIVPDSNKDTTGKDSL